MIMSSSHALPLAIISMPGGTEWVVIGLIALLLFGSRRPKVARSRGQAMHEFRSGLSGKTEEEKPEQTKVEEEKKTEETRQEG